MASPQDSIIDKFSDAVWGPRLAALPTWRARMLALIRLVLTLIRDLWAGELNARAMSLAYVTLVSVVPMLALSFSVLKAFGVHHQMEPMLAKLLAPLGADGADVTHHILAFISATDAGMPGAVGFGFLLYTAVALVQQIEESFNSIWRVKFAGGIAEQFVRYISVVLVGPILLFLALATATVVMNQDLVKHLIGIRSYREVEFWIGRLTPPAVVIIALTFIYSFIPNARVRFGAALLGGVLAGALWDVAGLVFSIVVTGSKSYAAIYSGFAVLILFMLWVYVSWFIVLLGASIAFYSQHPGHISTHGADGRVSNRMGERLALVVTGLIAMHHLNGWRPWSVAALSEAFDIPPSAINDVVRGLEKAELLAQTNDDPPLYLPARDVSSTLVADVIEVVRGLGEGRHVNPDNLPVNTVVDKIAAAMEAGISKSLNGLTVRDLVDPEDLVRNGPEAAK